ncbi:MAG: hypothetical protein ACREQ2_26080 [Candidatus Binatia bacterium]
MYVSFEILAGWAYILFGWGFTCLLKRFEERFAGCLDLFAPPNAVKTLYLGLQALHGVYWGAPFVALAVLIISGKAE